MCVCVVCTLSTDKLYTKTVTIVQIPLDILLNVVNWQNSNMKSLPLLVLCKIPWNSTT